jgi:hypothetical protein
MRRLVLLVAVLVLLVVSAAPASAAPSEGNSGKKLVVDEVFGPFDGPCDLAVTVYFTAQFRAKENGKNLEVATYNVNVVYENASGDTWTFKDRGADRLYEVDGVEYLSVTGRSGIGNIGHLILENPFTPQEEIVWQRGQMIDPDAEACERLG